MVRLVLDSLDGRILRLSHVFPMAKPAMSKESSCATKAQMVKRIGAMDLIAFVQKPFTLDQLQRTLASVFS